MARARPKPVSPIAPPPPLTDRFGDPTEIILVPVELVDVGDNVRTTPAEDDPRLLELADSIRELGVLQPIEVRRQGERYLLVYGQRRLMASRLAGRPTVPAVVAGDASDQDVATRAIVQLVENLQRDDLPPLDAARSIRAVLDADEDLTIEALAKRLGVSRSWLSNMLRLLDTAKPVQAAVEAGTLSVAHAKAIAGLEGKAEQAAAAKEALERGWSSAETERHVAWRKKRAEEDQAAARADEENAGELVAKLTKRGAKNGTTVYVPDERPGVQAALRSAGFKVKHGIRYTYSGDLEVVGAKDKCGCTALLVELGYKKGLDDAQVHRACDVKAHIAARRKAKSEAGAEAKREEQETAGRARADRIAATLEQQLRGTAPTDALRLLCYATLHTRGPTVGRQLAIELLGEERVDELEDPVLTTILEQPPEALWLLLVRGLVSNLLGVRSYYYQAPTLPPGIVQELERINLLSGPVDGVSP